MGAVTFAPFDGTEARTAVGACRTAVAPVTSLGGGRRWSRAMYAVTSSSTILASPSLCATSSTASGRVESMPESLRCSAL